MERTAQEIRKNMLEMGYNYAMVMSMSDYELKKADEIKDYSDFDDYMTDMAYEYDI